MYNICGRATWGKVTQGKDKITQGKSKLGRYKYPMKVIPCKVVPEKFNLGIIIQGKDRDTQDEFNQGVITNIEILLSQIH